MGAIAGRDGSPADDGLFRDSRPPRQSRSAGVGNSIAGHRADGAIIDDPFGKREDADSPVMRQRVWDWYTSDLYTRLSADAWIVLTHTRWHRDDLAGRLLRKMADRSADQWDVLCLPAVREEGPGDVCDKRQPGEVLWPSFKSAADLEIVRQQDARAYAALYQQNPADASGAEWAPELFGALFWVQPDKWPKKFDLRVVCVDASKGRSDKQGDYSAIVFLGVGKDRLLYIDALLERIPLDQIVRKTLVFCDHHQPHLVGIEAEQFQELLVHEFRRQCGEQLRAMADVHDDFAGHRQGGADPAAEPVRDQSRVAFQGRFAWLPPAGRSAHGFSPGRSRRRSRRLGDVYEVAAGGGSVIEG